MNLLFVHDHRFLRGAGDERYTQGSFPAQIWQRYLAHFDAVTVVARDGGCYTGEGLARSDREGVCFSLMRSPSYPERLGLVKGPAVATVTGLMEGCDAVIARLPSDLGLIAAREAVQRGLPLLLEVVGCARDGYGHQGSLAARFYAPMAAQRMRNAISRSSFALYVTERWLQERYPPAPDAQTASASNVNIEPAPPAQLADRERRLREIADGRPPVVGTVASLQTRSKGIQTMLEALATLRSTQKLAIEYRILGPGDPAPWRGLAAALGLGNSVTFEGARPAGRAVLEWLDGIDVHAQPSFQEGLPRATIEAMSRGCACIGSTAGGIPELIPAERLHAPGDVDGLARIISRLFADPAGISVASAEGRLISRRYEAARVEQDRLELFGKFADFAAARRRRN